MRTNYFTIVTYLIVTTVCCGQKYKDLNIDYMLSGSIYAQSSIEDEEALGGFADFGVLAKPIEKSEFKQTGLFLQIDTTETVIYEEIYNGYKLYLVNITNSIAEFDASDSRLDIVAEVFYNNKWQPIEYLPSSWCGNSYHKVYLKPNEYWGFDIPKFSGKIPTKIRYRLIMQEGEDIISNEIPASFNKKQLNNKKTYKSKGIMDPYSE